MILCVSADICIILIPIISRCFLDEATAQLLFSWHFCWP